MGETRPVSVNHNPRNNYYTAPRSGPVAFASSAAGVASRGKSGEKGHGRGAPCRWRGSGGEAPVRSSHLTEADRHSLETGIENLQTSFKVVNGEFVGLTEENRTVVDEPR